ncbi:MAG: hypothetical protein HY589_04835 [Candidatus Omnitrophica bacterium]|nr:hypothetical protein [Candidatus Omnitrophota bacterium]
MRYKRAFVNDYLEITVHTSSRHIHDLIENFMDFGDGPNRRKPRIRMVFHLNELKFKDKSDDSKFIYKSRFPDHNLLSYTLEKILSSATIDFDSGTVKGLVCGYEEPLKERVLDFLLMQPIRFFLARHGFFFLHASMVTRGNESILICGPKDSGKSTLAITLAENGFEFASDDDCFVKKTGDGIRVFPFPTKIGLNEEILKRHPALAKQVVTGYRYGGKQRLSFYQKRAAAKGHACRAVIFAGYSAGNKIRAKKIPREVAMKKLIKERLAIYPEKESLDLIGTFHALAKEAASFELVYNDKRLEQVPRIIKRLTGL